MCTIELRILSHHTLNNIQSSFIDGGHIGDTNHVVVDPTTHGINVTVNCCGADCTIARDCTVWTNFSDIFIDSSGSLVTMVEDNNGGSRDGPCMYMNGASPSF